MLNISELKIDDTVAYYRSHYGTFLEKGFGTVTKINGHGHVTIVVHGTNDPKFKVFDKHGKERNRSYAATRLCDAAWLEGQLKELEAHHVKQQAIRDLLKYLDGRKCGNGGYSIDDSHKDEIKKLVDSI